MVDNLSPKPTPSRLRVCRLGVRFFHWHKNMYSVVSNVWLVCAYLYQCVYVSVCVRLQLCCMFSRCGTTANRWVSTRQPDSFHVPPQMMTLYLLTVTFPQNTCLTVKPAFPQTRHTTETQRVLYRRAHRFETKARLFSSHRPLVSPSSTGCAPHMCRHK